MKYNVQFIYYIPEWSEVEVNAETPDDAEKLASVELSRLYPEAVDIECEGITTIA